MTDDVSAGTAVPPTSPPRPTPPWLGAVLAYLRGAPFAAALAVLVVAMGFVTGTFLGRFPAELAAGEGTTVDQGLWWTPFTALLFGDSVVGGLLAIALILTAGAYAERTPGSVRSVWVFFVTGVLGILIGVGSQALLVSWGSQWGVLASFDLVADPTIGTVGLLMAASAFAPALWQRRIRVVGFTLLLMFALYAADSDSVFRLLSGVLGLILGAVLARGTVRPSWHRSSYREVRTLVAAIVGATGLGPIIVLVSGSWYAPLGLVVSGFSPVEAQPMDKSCVQDFTADCTRQAAAILQSGPGPFLISLVPLVLTLLAAWGLRTGRRAAWIMALVVNAAVAVLTATAVGINDLLDDKARGNLLIEDGIAMILAVLVPIGVIALLLLTRRRFQVTAPRAAVRRFTATVVGAFVVCAGIYVVIGLIDGDNYLDGQPSIGELLADLVRPFVSPGLLPDIADAGIPVDGAALVVYQWIGVPFWIVFVFAAIRLFRATHVSSLAIEEARFRALLRDGGGGTLGFMGTWTGNTHWFTPDGRGAIAYRVINKVALTMSDPVCPEGAERDTIEGFIGYCEAQGWSACFYSFHERYLPIFQSFGWQYMSVGEETVLDLPGFELTGKAWQKVRQPLNRGEREGMTTLWSTWHDLPSRYSREITAVSEEWVAHKKLPEMGFTLGGMEELKDSDVGIFLAINKDGGIEATTSWLPSWTDGRITGWTIDFMRRSDGAMPGIMEFVIASAALHMKEQGAQVMSLSGAPLATKPGEEAPDPTVMSRLLGWLGEMLEPAYGFTSLFRFKSKFNPRYETIYMAYADPAQLPRIGMAIGSAYLPEATPKEYLALMQTITNRGGEH
ncbi:MULTISPECIES: bifunctional lysylphosphatidylglycerol flippase/synthetase MprF [unclassified Microbacterium]|uniref:bifunctional lysylphosphatidylglycerol flippase/synthetase MprF n=1 Tax=unclassified Microbacterium TaxID=2609290 RepID=UPI0030185E07